jgi:FkbM family methyltransferase
MISRTIKTSQQASYAIETEQPDIVAWFDNPENYTDIILKQINEDRMYDPIFANRSDMTVIDLGANCGLFSLYAHDSCSRLISVEPTPNTLKVLEEMTAGHDNITVVQAAIGPDNNPVTFYLNENSTTNSMLNRKGTAITVPGMTLEQLLDSQNLDYVDFIKCDIEGSEMVALTETTLAPIADRVGFWFVEVHQTDVDRGPWPGNLESNRSALATLFQKFGYQTENVIHDQLFAWK